MKVLRFIALDRADIPTFIKAALGSRASAALGTQARTELVSAAEFYRLVRFDDVLLDIWVRPDEEDGQQIGTDPDGNPVYRRVRRGWQVDVRFREGEALADILTARIGGMTTTMPWRSRKTRRALSLRRFAGLGAIEPTSPDYHYAEYVKATAVTDPPPDLGPVVSIGT